MQKFKRGIERSPEEKFFFKQKKIKKRNFEE
jgi:hypothetical protein